ncbi:MAG: FG-GAP repeat protein [Planctomycetota bacterium]
MNGAAQAGAVYVRTSVLTPNPAWVVVTEPTIGGSGGPRQGDRFGFRILVGDLNLDGYQDVVVSARGVRIDKDCEQGEVFVLYGPWTLVPSPTTPPYAGGAIGIVEDVYHRNNPPNDTYGDRFGFRIALGDPNQDGYPDLVVGSPYSRIPPYPNQNGEAYVYWGPSFSAWLELVLPWDSPGSAALLSIDRLWGGTSHAATSRTGSEAPMMTSSCRSLQLRQRCS